jgi:O-antigen ligase
MNLRRIVYWLSLVFIFMLPWEGVIQVAGGAGTAAKFLGLLVGALWLVNVFITGRMRNPDPFLGATALFVLWNAVSVLWSAAPGQSLRHVATMIQCLGFVLILWDVYRTRTALLAGLQAYVLGVYVAVMSAVLNFLNASTSFAHYERYSPGLTHPDGFGFVVALGIPLAWYLAGPASPDQRNLIRIVNYAYIPAALFGIALSGTRTALIASIPGMVFGLASLTSLRLPTRTAIFVVLITSLYLLTPVVEPLRSFERLATTHAEARQGNLSGRRDQWRESLASFGERPILGVGTNMFRSVNNQGKVAHNSFLSILIELGLIGLALFGAVVMIAVIHALRQPGWHRIFCLVILLVWAIGASALTWEDRKTTWLFMGMVVVSAALRPQRQATESVMRLGPSGRIVVRT